MKRNLILISLSILMAIGVSSCKKRYTCSCTWVDTETNFTGTDNYELGKSRKSIAVLECANYESNYWYTNKTASCELK